MPDVLVAIDKESPAASGRNAAGASMAALLREGPTRSKITLRRIEIRRDEAGLCREKKLRRGVEHAHRSRDGALDMREQRVNTASNIAEWTCRLTVSRSGCPSQATEVAFVARSDIGRFASV
jgi:hypothetical protein